MTPFSWFSVLRHHQVLSTRLGFVVQRNIFRNMRILNVAEKNDAAKNISSQLSNGVTQKREGLSVYNKIYEFDLQILNQNCRMIMTSVSGHLLSYEFASLYRGWQSCDPLALFDAPVSKQCPENYQKIKKTLEREIRTCSKLIIWTDCDREGENIGFEIIKVCKDVKPNIEILRAKFSEITRSSVFRAISNLVQPDKNVSDAVDVRMELDLRIGAAFTRLQTLHLKRMFPQALADNLISYGSCQFPTLGFVVERYKAISEFKSEPFWKLKVTDTRDDLTVEFAWKRVRVFDELACTVLFDTCMENPMAKVEKVQSKPKSKWRPKPLDTVEMEKLVSIKLRISAKECMGIAEKLYTRGLISYPRTETNIFPDNINLVPLVENQANDPNWGEFAQRVLRDGPNPFQGKKSDQAHPPIHPTKYAPDLAGREKSVYEFIVRHFLACLSKHAEGLETVVDIDIANEKFSAKGLMIIARNYLDVYPYEKWNAKEIHIYETGQSFLPHIEIAEGETGPPDLLTEADLIALMDKHGIGTDATHAEHIETIKSRMYVGLKDEKYFLPQTLGMGLVEGYDSMGFEMSKPHLRSDLESDLKRICDGEKQPGDVLRDQIRKYKDTFQETQRQLQKLTEAVKTFLKVQPTTVGANDAPMFASAPQRVAPCSKCGKFLVLRSKQDGGKFLSCEGYPGCREALWMPSSVLDVTADTETCPTCGPPSILLNFKFSPGSCYLPPTYKSCVNGCDSILMNVLRGPPGSNFRPTFSSNENQSTNSQQSRLPSSSFTSSNSTSNTRGGSSSSDSVNCNCGKSAILLTVRKAGPNQGRQFWKCDVPQGASGCDFFQWADGDTGVTNSGSRPPRPPGPPPGSSNLVNDAPTNCNCGQLAKRLTVQKDGPTKGRCFYCCSKPIADHSRCKFFQWSDSDANLDPPPRNNFPNSFNSSRGNTGSFPARATKRTATRDASGQPKKRKCGICGEEGHNRKNCSQR